MAGRPVSDLRDPRVFFAAERTLLAWTRTSLTLMAFGFVIERFGLFLEVLLGRSSHALQRDVAFWIGAAFVLLGIVVSTLASIEYRRVLKGLAPVEIPPGYRAQLGVLTNLAVALLGAALAAYLFYQAR
jgi:putative membrane protein